MRTKITDARHRIAGKVLSGGGFEITGGFTDPPIVHAQHGNAAARQIVSQHQEGLVNP